MYKRPFRVLIKDRERKRWIRVSLRTDTSNRSIVGVCVPRGRPGTERTPSNRRILSAHMTDSPAVGWPLPTRFPAFSAFLHRDHSSLRFEKVFLLFFLRDSKFNRSFIQKKKKKKWRIFIYKKFFIGNKDVKYEVSIL